MKSAWLQFLFKMIPLTILLKADLQTEACLKGGFMSRTRITIFMSPHFCLHLHIFAHSCSVRLNSASLSFPSHFLNFIDSPLFLSLSLFTLQWQAVPSKLPLSKWEFESIQLTHQPAPFFSPSSVFLSSSLCLTSSTRILLSYRCIKS